jgi:hypothetical protein
MYATLDYSGGKGLILDLPPHMLAADVWSGAKNVRFQNNLAERIKGHSKLLDTSVPPIGFACAPYLGVNYYVYMGAAKAYAWDGDTNTNITRQDLGSDDDYSATVLGGWNGCLHGGILIANNGIDPPQSWVPSLSNDFQNLANWPANTTAKVIRGFKSFLVALDVTKSGTRYPYMVKTSHPSDPGAVPSSWDHTDVTKLAIEHNLGESYDEIVDCLTLQDINIIYRRNSTWGMQYVGLPTVFRFWRILEKHGMFSRNCAVNFLSSYHAVLTEDDFIVHNGTPTVESKIEGRIRKALFNEIDSTNWPLTFLAHQRSLKEIWVCFPSAGSSYCDRAYVWNYALDRWSSRDLPQVVFMDNAYLVQADEIIDIWNTGPDDTWNAGPDERWNEAMKFPVRQELIGVSYANSKIFRFDDTNQFETVNFESSLQRIGLPIQEIKPDGNVTLNTGTWKILRGIRPRFRADPGASFTIRIGAQDTINAPVRWEHVTTFDPEIEFEVPCIISGRLFSLEISLNTDHAWELVGIDVDVDYTGEY